MIAVRTLTVPGEWEASQPLAIRDDERVVSAEFSPWKHDDPNFTDSGGYHGYWKFVIERRI